MPGATLPNATELARQMAVSRTALREAIKLFAGKGLVESTPQRGTVICSRLAWNRLDEDVLVWQTGKKPNAAFMRDLYELRRIVEPEAAALAATRATSTHLADIGRALSMMASAKLDSPLSVGADVAFHLLILVASGNDFLASFAPAIRTSLTIAISFQRTSCHAVGHFVPDHQAIVAAIRRGDADSARAAALKQLSRAEGDASEALKRGSRAAWSQFNAPTDFLGPGAIVAGPMGDGDIQGR